MKTEIIRANHPVALDHAADVLAHGGLVVFPTDTVYGLAAQLFDSQAVERLYIVKGRSSDRAIAVLIGQIEHLKSVARQMNPLAIKLAQRFWPGPMTLVVPGSSSLPPNLSPTENVGVRMPDHPVALALLRKTGPLAVTSANMSGQPNANTPQDVLDQLEGRIHLLLDGGVTPGGIPSTVVDCTGDKPIILRAGPISQDDLEAVLA